jgi:hypothetical protein
MQIKYIFCFLFINLVQLNSFCQSQINFLPGVTVDPGIEKICKLKKEHINLFDIVHFINDTKDENSFLSMLPPMPLQSMVSVSETDTLLTSIHMLGAMGFQIILKNDATYVKTFISSKHCKCFKSSLADSLLSYGAGNTPDTVMLVLSKRNNLKKGDKIYGYLKTKGGNVYRFPNEDVKYDTERYDYEGYFEITFDSFIN